MARPNVDYQGQVRSDTHAWTNTGCTLRYGETPPPPACISTVSVPANGSTIPADGQDVTATITGQNANQYRIVDGSGNVVAGPSASNELPFMAMPNVDYQGQVRSDTHAWTTPVVPCRYGETLPPPPPACISIVSIPANGSVILPTTRRYRHHHG